MSQKLSLIPMPKHFESENGFFEFEDEGLIFLDTNSNELFIVGKEIKEALKILGVEHELTTSKGKNFEKVTVRVFVDPYQLPQPQGYTLTVSKNGIKILSHDFAGAFYAAMTLKQMARNFKDQKKLPFSKIKDWPDFPNRGVMLDISRDKVPKMETLYNLIDMLAELKINQFQLYTEHTFAYRNHRIVWENASPITPEEILELDRYCKKRFIELVPNQNSFGHMNRWLKHKEYKHLAEAPDGFEFPWGGRFDEPFSLCPLEEGSIELLKELYDELLPHFSSNQFNVGCDETFDLGQGKSKKACEEKGVGRVYLEFLLKIHKLVQEKGKTMQFWGDIIVKHPELIPELPDGVIALEWGYEANHPFDEDGAKFAQAGIPYYVCPGTSSWNSIAGRTENAIGNLKNAAENGLKHGAIGYLNTDWGDNGHWQHFPVSFLGFAYGAAMSWNYKGNIDIDIQEALNIHVFKDQAKKMGKIAYDLGNAYKVPGFIPHNSSILALMLLFPEPPVYLKIDTFKDVLTEENFKKTIEYIDEVIKDLDEVRMDRPDADLIIKEYRNAAKLLKHAAKQGIERVKTKDFKVSSISKDIRNELAKELDEIIEEYKDLWLQRNRIGGLKDSIERFERLKKAYMI